MKQGQVVDAGAIGKPALAAACPGPNRFRRVGWFVAGLSLCFGKPLYDLAVFAAHSELYSHILLIPVVSAFLIWLRRGRLPGAASSSPIPAALFGALGLAALACHGVARWRGAELPLNDYLSLTIFAYVSLLVAGAFLLAGAGTMRTIAFPAAFLVFMIPFPLVVTDWIEMFFQHTSAYATAWMMAPTGTPMVHEGLAFRLPGITITVGQECSGIHSSLVLFITSLLAAHLFLVTRWKKAALALFVIPLGIVRNAFRISTISLLCVHHDVSWIDSALHRRGGPVFFALSLIPFFLLLWWLRKSERETPRHVTLHG